MNKMNNPNIYGKRNSKSSIWKYLLFWLLIIILVITLVFTMSGRRREIVTWTHNDIRNYLTNTELQEVIPEDGTIDDVDVEIKEALESEYL